MDDLNQPYPPAPWQLQQYMNASILMLRDANWYTNFPTTAQWVEFLYAYSHPGPAQGVIAIDQQALVAVLSVVGPLQVEGFDAPVTAQNAITLMRAAKTVPSAEFGATNGDRKAFINVTFDALMKKLLAGRDISWVDLAQTMRNLLDQHHILIEIDDPAAEELLARRGWDGALRPGAGDFLMAVDSNIGFNKTNAKVERSLAYKVDLSDLSAPRSHLTVSHTNLATSEHPCQQWDPAQNSDQNKYPIDRCYYDYLRVYMPMGTDLLGATPHAVTGVLLGQDVPPRVDPLDEKIKGVQAFGTFLLVPGGGTLETGFDFGLPPSILSPLPGTGQWLYQLKIQKQPGTLAEKLQLSLQFSDQAQLVEFTPGGVWQDQRLTYQLSLQRDVEIRVTFRP